MEAQDFVDPEVHHRHLSHLFGLYPGHTITMQKNPEICEAIANSLQKRGLYNKLMCYCIISILFMYYT
jgi:hypothetical protein